MYDHNAIKIYTDGSSIPNPGKGGIGIVIEFPDNFNKENIEISEGYISSTNNRMELLACIEGIRWLKNNSSLYRIARAIFITDSEYVYNNYVNVQYWKKDDWKNQYGKPYENKDLWDAFLKERQKLSVHNEIKWEKGKTRPILLKVDALAKKGAKHPTKIDNGYRAGKFTRSRTESKKAATIFPANNDKLIIRVYAKKNYGKNEHEIYKITFDVYDEKLDIYSQKYFAYLDKECVALKRNNCYKIIMNNDPKFPLIIKAKLIPYLKGR